MDTDINWTLTSFSKALNPSPNTFNKSYIILLTFSEDSLDQCCCLLILVERGVLCYVVFVVVKEEKIISSSVLEDLEVEHYLSEFGYYYFASVCSKFQDGVVIFCPGVVGIK